MDNVNKEQAERCRDIGAEALRNGQYERAVKFLSKSIQLHPLPGVSALLTQAQKRLSDTSGAGDVNDNQSNSQKSGNETGATPNNVNHHNSTSSHGTTRDSTRVPPSRSESAASTATSIGADGRAYDENQVELIKKIIQAKASGRQAHYKVLGIPPDADGNAIKKAYRKLALKLHPDKNSAPGADEAFKAIGLAYATLSDDQKRAIYDRYGDEDPDNRGGGGGGFRPGRHGGGVHFNGQEVNPEDIFNAFFGGGMPGGMHVGGMPGGFRVYSTGFGGGRGFHTRAGGAGMGGRAQEAQAQPQAGIQMLFQLLPILLLFFMSFFNLPGETGSGHTGGNTYFSLTHSPPYVNPLKTRVTQVKEIPFFVTDAFMRTYARDKFQLSQVERMVEKSYKNYLIHECKNQQIYKSSLEKAAMSRNGMTQVDRERQLKKAHEFELSRCMELESLFNVKLN